MMKLRNFKFKLTSSLLIITISFIVIYNASFVSSNIAQDSVKVKTTVSNSSCTSSMISNNTMKLKGPISISAINYHAMCEGSIAVCRGVGCSAIEVSGICQKDPIGICIKWFIQCSTCNSGYTDCA